MKNKFLEKLLLIGGFAALPFCANAAPDPNFHILPDAGAIQYGGRGPHSVTGQFLSPAGAGSCRAKAVAAD
ncbi:MAG: hypothetical protein NVV73_01370 [Cellvibrionaceae bacterium]|nr:hypothetical protein [Cellvibrionaceae bacterium]